jgi:hypothetical protein
MTRRNAPICRSNAIFDARPCTRVPPHNLHGKEGVDGFESVRELVAYPGNYCA